MAIRYREVDEIEAKPSIAARKLVAAVVVLPQSGPTDGPVAPQGDKPGRMAPKMNLRMFEDEWDMLDRARGKLSRNDMIRVLVRNVDRLT